MAVDTLLALQASVTKTATFNGAGLNIPYGNGLKVGYARVLFSAAGNASGANAVAFSVDYSLDNGATWNAGESAPPVNLVVATQTGEKYVPFALPVDARTTTTPANILIRLSATFSGAGATPTITYLCDGCTFSAP